MDCMSDNDNNDKIIYEAVQTEDNLPLKISFYDSQRDKLNYFVPMNWHRSLQIVVPMNNLLEVWIEGKIYIIEPGHFIIINSKDVHSCRSVKRDEDYFGYTIQIKYDYLKFIYKDIDSCLFDYVCHEGEEEVMEIINHLIEVYYQDDALKNAQIISCCCQLIYILIKDHSHKKGIDYNDYSLKQKDRLVEILNYLEEHSDDITDVQAVADHFNLSYGYLANLFKTVLNTTVHDCLNLIRIKKIGNDLITTDKSISDICLSHGFNNTKSFYRVFKKYNGLTPKEYRNKAREQKL